MTTPKTDNQKKLILFIHGFTGGKKTWIGVDGVKRIPEFLKEDIEIFENYDFQFFEYYTKWTDKIEKLLWLRSLFSKERKLKKNISIDDIKDILFSQIDVNYKKYDDIVIIAHSMGGLISKAAILKLMGENKNKISLFISLAVPHNGSNLANLGKILLNNTNLRDLQPLSDIIESTNRDWLETNNKNLLPKIIYFQGKNDIVVPNSSSYGYNAGQKGTNFEIVYTDDDHFSILKPENENSTVVISIKNELINNLKKKEIDAKILTDQTKYTLEKIEKKLDLQIPTFEDLLISKDSIPLLSAQISNRENTISRLLKSCERNWLAIYGIYDTGKTQLAILISQYLKYPTVWINCKDLDSEFFIQKIIRAFDATNESHLFEIIKQSKSESKKLLVLDDLIDLGIKGKIDSFLNQLIKICLESNYFILSTSNFKIHSNVKDIHYSNIYEVEVPLLDELETLEIVSLYPKSQNFTPKRIIFTLAKGYPIYTQIICRYLDSKNWTINENEIQDFVTGKIFTDLTDETIKKLVEKVQDDETRELLYRLNIVLTKISNIEINIVAQCNPNIALPQEKVNSLVGTWIQKVNNSDLILSPLIKRLGTINISENIVKDINYKLGKSIFDKGKISQIDAFFIIQYYIAAKKFDDAGFILMSLLQNVASDKDYFFKWNFNLFWYNDELPVEMSLFIRLFIRTQHLIIATSIDLESSNEIDFLRNDLENLVTDALASKVDVFLPSILLATSYLKENPKKAIKYFTYYKNSYTYNNSQQDLLDIFPNDIHKNNDGLIWLLLMEISNIELLNEWFDNYEKLSIDIIHFDNEQVDLLSERLYFNFILEEEKKAQPNWEELLKTFTIIFEKADKLNLEILKAYSIKKQIQIISEKLNDVNSAEELFKNHISSFTKSSAIFLITDELGRQFYYKGFKDKSFKYLDEIKYIEVGQYNIVKIDTYTILAKLFGDIDKDIAQRYMEYALSFAENNIYVDELSYIKLIGENAVSLYLNGKISESLIELSKGYELLLNSFENDDDFKNVQVIYGNTISYIYKHFDKKKQPLDSNTHTPPYRGIFTNNNKKLADYYTDVKRVILIANIIWFFEEIRDRESAYRWSKMVFSFMKDIDIQEYKMVFVGITGYKILDDKYEEVIMDQIEIYNSNEKFLSPSSSNVTENLKNYRIDFAVIVSAITPIYIRLLNKYFIHEIEIEQVNSIVKSLILQFKDFMEDEVVVANTIHVLENYPKNQDESQNLMSYINSFDSGKFGQIQFLGYIICSMEMRSKVALQTHFVFKEIFQLYTGSINLYIVVPFFIEFWKQKIINEKDKFSNIKKLIYNLDKVQNLKNNLQIKAIFALIAESLNYNLTPEHIQWLQDYYDEYIY